MDLYQGPPTFVSRVGVVSQHPRSHREWRIALQHVKLLYLDRQYKHCTARCRQLLDDTASKDVNQIVTMSLHFYWAMSQDTVGRLRHALSPTKLPLLHEALDHYLLAGNLASAAEFGASSLFLSSESSVSTSPSSTGTPNMSVPASKNAVKVTSLAYNDTGAQFMEKLGDFSMRIQYHVQSVHALIQQTMDAQAKHRRAEDLSPTARLPRHIADMKAKYQSPPGEFMDHGGVLQRGVVITGHYGMDERVIHAEEGTPDQALM